MKELTPEDFLIRHIAGGEKYEAFIQESHVDLKQLRAWYADEKFDALRKMIRRSNQLFNGRVGKPEFEEFERLGKVEFYYWFEKQYNEQNGCCAYCEISEIKLQVIFETNTLSTKRKRGKVLELERTDAKDNVYSPDNCVLACYLCNNHKSDLITEEDHMNYFAPKIKEYLEAKYIEARNK